jgi:TolB-like protein/DNA-binding winged helix-turn-helix (wHTH) protein/Tfp pilus assembly protein PilF
VQGLQSDIASDAASVSAWRWGEYLLRPAKRQLWHGEAPVEVEDRVLDLLLLLLQHRERALNRQEIIGSLWGKRPVSDATLRHLVYKARRAVGDDGEQQAVISTMYGRSVRWVAPVEQVSAADEHVVLAPKASDAAIPSAALPAIAPPVSLSANADAAVTVAPPFPARGARRRIAWLAAAILLSAVAVTLAAWVHWHVGAAPVSARAPATAHARTPADAGVTTLAVLPFDDSDPRQTQRYISDGLTEELINRLARMPKLRVTARTSSFAFRDRQVDVREVARRLGVTDVLEGSVQRAGNDLRVRVALVDASNGYDLWTGEYDTPVGDVLGMEDQITRNVIGTLYPRLAAVPAQPVDPDLQPAAHDAYLVGLEYMGRRNRADLEQAIVYFQHAVSLDPSYAEAWAALASVWGVWSDYDGNAPPDQHYDDALAAARHAVSLNPDLAHAHAVLGMLYMKHWQWRQAIAEYRRALALDPSDAAAHQWYGIYLWYTGDDGGALAQFRIAVKLDPLSSIINIDLGRALLYAGHTNEAVTQYREAAALNPQSAFGHILLAEAYMAQNRFPDALRETRAAIALAPSPAPPSYFAMLGVALSLTHDDAGARAQLASLESRSHEHYVSGVSLAFLSAQLGQYDKVFPYLFASEAAHDPMMLPAVADRTAWWYSDPRMAALRTKMGLPPR